MKHRGKKSLKSPVEPVDIFSMKKTPLDTMTAAEQIAAEVAAQGMTFRPYDRSAGATIAAQARGRRVMVYFDEGVLCVAAEDTAVDFEVLGTIERTR